MVNTLKFLLQGGGDDDNTSVVDEEFEADDAEAEDVEDEGKDEGDRVLQQNLGEASSVYSCKHCQFVTKQSGAMRHHVMAHFGKQRSEILTRITMIDQKSTLLKMKTYWASH